MPPEQPDIIVALAAATVPFASLITVRTQYFAGKCSLLSYSSENTQTVYTLNACVDFSQEMSDLEPHSKMPPVSTHTSIHHLQIAQMATTLSTTLLAASAAISITAKISKIGSAKFAVALKQPAKIIAAIAAYTTILAYAAAEHATRYLTFHDQEAAVGDAYYALMALNAANLFTLAIESMPQKKLSL